MKTPFINSNLSCSNTSNDVNLIRKLNREYSRARTSISGVAAFLLLFLFAFSGTAYAQVISGDYFVFDAGTSWIWRATQNGTVSEISSSIADDTVLINGVDTIPLEFSDGSKFFFSEDQDGYKIHRLIQPSSAELQPGVFVDVTITLDPPVVFVSQVVDAGDTFTGSGTATVELAGVGTGSVAYQSQSTFEGIESVSVPAGDFDDTMHVDSSFSLSGTLLGQPFAQVQGFEQWVGNSVGFVKFIQDANGAITTSELLTSSFIDTPVDLSGTVETADSTSLCAMVLASGQFMFSCNPNGPFSLTGLPRENDGTVKRQVYVDGFFPEIDVLPDTVDETVVMTRAGTCPSYNTPYDPGVFPDSAGQRIDISGSVLLQDTPTPICAMVLANGQFMFSCDGSGSYALNIPLDTNGQFKLQVYADGFAPTIQSFDEFSATNDVRMARAVECQ
jgi:hypothetical protein